ncbi:MAG: hypothetical protein FJW14_06965 [Acidimicrobiia bacterium]|nr:hypothetical protein [Acidimicrobiia bacterium]
MSAGGQAIEVAVEAVEEIVADVEIEPPVAVDVDEGRRHAPPPGVRRAAPRGDVAEPAVAVVVQQHAAIEPGAIEIDASVVVEIARGHAHAVGPHVDAAGVGDVGEPQQGRPVRRGREIVPEETVARNSARRKHRLLGGLARAKHLALDEIHVQISVVVVVEQADTGPHDLRVVELAGHAVEVHEVEPRRGGPLDEPFGWRRR